jgi:inosine/xanthosine triphosphatase
LPVKTVIVASHNPVKLLAVRRGFERMFPQESFEFIGVSLPSGVSHQPRSDAETMRGALNRASAAAVSRPQADYWVGVEGGIQDDGDEMVAFAWIVVRSAHSLGKGRTGTFYLPQKVAELVHQGLELGDADDIVFGRSNSKQENGAIGILTDDVIDRAQLYEQAAIMALIPAKNPALYPN